MNMEYLDKTVDLNVTSFLVTIFILVLGVWAVHRRIVYKKFYELAETINNPDLSLWPIIGHAHHFLVTKDVIYKLFEKFEKYDYPTKIWLGPKLYVCLTRPEDMEICFNKLLDKSSPYDYLKYLWSDGLLTLSGSKWKRHRKMLMPVFNQKILDGFVGCFVEKSEGILDYIEEQNGKTFDIGERLFVTSVETLRKTCVGYDGDRKDTWIYTEIINEMFELISTRAFNLMYRLNFVYLLSPDYRRLSKINKTFMDMNNQSWAEKTGRLRESKEELLVSSSTFFDHLVQISENGANFTEKEITDHMQTFILAGSDATYSASAFCLLMLAMHPNIQQRVYEEIQEVIGCSVITASSLARLHYTERAIKETLRLFPVAPVVLRAANEDLKLEKCTIPKGASVFFATFVTHRSPRTYKDPLVFDPDRFLPEEVAKRHPYSYHPFTLGPRKCMGVVYGTNLVKTIIATVIGNYRLETHLKSVEEIDLKITAVLRSVQGFPVKATKRDV